MLRVILVILIAVLVELPVCAKSANLRDLPPGLYTYTDPLTNHVETCYVDGPGMPTDPMEAPRRVLPAKYLPVLCPSAFPVQPQSSGNGLRNILAKTGKGLGSVLQWSGQTLSGFGAAYRQYPTQGPMTTIDPLAATSDPESSVDAVTTGFLATRRSSFTPAFGSNYDIVRSGDTVSLFGTGLAAGHGYIANSFGNTTTMFGTGRSAGSSYTVIPFGRSYTVLGGGSAAGESFNILPMGSRGGWTVSGSANSTIIPIGSGYSVLP